ncbi:MAG: type VI secretion system baseplate subunit TssE [Deltaproteobacteria bacterium]|nr:type VI secretion system baseplate subunit TssE [Deltaproteobacteria bacterium]
MAELTQQERLQPSLLDRLTDEEPDKRQESREQRVLSLRRLREGVRRDLAWLLNTGHLASTEDLTPFPAIARSVLNYGIPDLAGATASSADVGSLERLIRQAVWDFEPRILRNTVRVKAMVDDAQMGHNALTFVIEGELWAQPVPLHLLLKSDIDLETGAVLVTEHDGQGFG